MLWVAELGAIEESLDQILISYTLLGPTGSQLIILVDCQHSKYTIN